jgi:hypothetical protein
MGLKKWLLKRGLGGMIPKNAVEQFTKWKIRSPEMSEDEIAKGIFTLRYLATDPTFDEDESKRFISYMKGQFECRCLLDFCLASLDIEGGIDPSDGVVFEEAADLVIEGLEERGFRIGQDDLEKFHEKWWSHVSTSRS